MMAFAGPQKLTLTKFGQGLEVDWNPPVGQRGRWPWRSGYRYIAVGQAGTSAQDVEEMFWSKKLAQEACDKFIDEFVGLEEQRALLGGGPRHKTRIGPRPS